MHATQGAAGEDPQTLTTGYLIINDGEPVGWARSWGDGMAYILTKLAGDVSDLGEKERQSLRDFLDQRDTAFPSEDWCLEDWYSASEWWLFDLGAIAGTAPVQGFAELRAALADVSGGKEAL